MPVSKDDVRHVAGLARIGVPEDRLDRLVSELSGILAHMDVLASVDTSGLAAALADGMSLAADEPPPVALDRPREDYAPVTRDGFFLVPRLSTHEDGEESA